MLTYASATKVAFMPSVGASIKVKLKENVLLSFNFDYRHAKYQYTDVASSVNGIPTGNYDYTVKTDIISVGAGVGFAF